MTSQLEMFEQRRVAEADFRRRYGADACRVEVPDRSVTRVFRWEPCQGLDPITEVPLAYLQPHEVVRIRCGGVLQCYDRKALLTYLIGRIKSFQPLTCPVNARYEFSRADIEQFAGRPMSYWVAFQYEHVMRWVRWLRSRKGKIVVGAVIAVAIAALVAYLMGSFDYGTAAVSQAVQHTHAAAADVGAAAWDSMKHAISPEQMLERTQRAVAHMLDYFPDTKYTFIRHTIDYLFKDDAAMQSKYQRIFLKLAETNFDHLRTILQRILSDPQAAIEWLHHVGVHKHAARIAAAAPHQPTANLLEYFIY
jgi:hypothetical protein